MTKENMTVIGSNALIEIVGVMQHVPAKIDTGADSSALWASNIYVDEKGVLHYTLFGKSSPFYTGADFTTKQFTVASVISSTGHREIRYRVKLSIRISGRLVKAQFNLSNRSVHNFPVLIGRRTLKGKFLVDVAQRAVVIPSEKTAELNKEMLRDPYAFYEKYHAQKQK
jgi:hypothetical protein